MNSLRNIKAIIYFATSCEKIQDLEVEKWKSIAILLLDSRLQLVGVLFSKILKLLPEMC